MSTGPGRDPNEDLTHGGITHSTVDSASIPEQVINLPIYHDSACQYIARMLSFAVRHDSEPEVEGFDMIDVNDAVERLANGSPR